MKSRKIAVCLSGQPRLWKIALPSLIHYFNSDIHEVHFFGHAWDENSWKTLVKNEKDSIVEKLDIEKLEREIRESVPLDGLIIEKQWYPPKDVDWRTWTPMFKSAALSNYLKCKYEIENNMTFDIVVKTRWDVVYDPRFKFEFFVNDFFNSNVLYCNLVNDFSWEFRLPAIDDVMYFGSSRVMNILSGMYLPYVGEGVANRWRADDNNPIFLFVGGGVLLHKWATLHNIGLVEPHNFLTPIVLRKTLDDLRWPKDYAMMEHNFKNFSAV